MDIERYLEVYISYIYIYIYIYIYDIYIGLRIYIPGKSPHLSHQPQSQM